jgi:CubicO group peptidase (beta-lactamase class C family)
MAATAVNVLADRGLLALDAPVADYWPEFGQKGEGALSRGLALTHQAGLAAIDRPLTLGSQGSNSSVTGCVEHAAGEVDDGHLPPRQRARPGRQYRPRLRAASPAARPTRAPAAAPASSPAATLSAGLPKAT